MSQDAAQAENEARQSETQPERQQQRQRPKVTDSKYVQVGVNIKINYCAKWVTLVDICTRFVILLSCPWPMPLICPYSLPPFSLVQCM